MIFYKSYFLFLLLLVIPFFLIEFLKKKKKISSFSILKEEILRKRKDKFFYLFIFRISALILVILALSEFSIMFPSNRNNIIFIFDVSKSIKNDDIERSRRTSLEIIKKLNKNDRISIALFSDDFRIIDQNLDPQKAIKILETAKLESSDSARTNIIQALNLSNEILKKMFGNKNIILFSDGRDTSGNIDLRSITISKDVVINIFPLGENTISIIPSDFVMPQYSESKSKFNVNWNLIGLSDQIIDLSTKVNGKTVKVEKQKIQKGNNFISSEMMINDPGVYKIDLEAVFEKNSVTTSGVINIQGEKQVLLIDNKNNSPLYNVLSKNGISVRKISSTDFPDSEAVLQGFNLVILDNIKASLLNQNGQKAIKSFVINGGSLLVVGGDESLGRGEYYSSDIEDVLPVNTDTRKRMLFSRTSILFIIDQSGSMEENIGSVTKQEIAMLGIKEAVKELKPADEVGIISFDTKAYWVLPFTEVSNKEKILKSLSGISRGGGTNMTTALNEAVKAYSANRPFQRHIILLSDGITLGENFKELADKLKEEDVAITSLGFGEDVNEKLMSDLAEWTDGKYYRVNFEDVPKVMNKETIKITKELVQEGDFKVNINSDSKIFSGIESIPNVYGYINTKPKKFSDTLLFINNEDSLLSVWNFGNGRSAVFSSDSGERWLASWSNGRTYNYFWPSLVKYLEKPDGKDKLRVNVFTSGTKAKINIEALEDNKKLISGLHLTGYNSTTDENFYFKEIESGIYEFDYTLKNPGLNIIEIHDYYNKSMKIISLWNNSNQEQVNLGPDLIFFKKLIQKSNGAIINGTQHIKVNRKYEFTPITLNYLLILLACLIFVVELAVRSTSSGQLSMFKIFLINWWAKQKNILAGLRTNKFLDKDNEIYKNYNTELDARKYLAEKLKNKKKTND